MSATASSPPEYLAGKILVVDDDQGILYVIRSILEDAGFEVWTADSGLSALRLIEEKGPPHLGLIDIMMPGMTGLDLCRRIQESIDLPTIMLTAVDEPATVAQSLDEVAEDYIRKPFEASELVARIRRLLRRIGNFSYALAATIEVDDRLSVMLARRTVEIDGTAIDLTPIETKILHLLMQRAGSTITSEFLIRRLWPFREVFEESLRTHIYRLRQKIELDPKRPTYIATVRGEGYRFLAPQRSTRSRAPD